MSTAGTARRCQRAPVAPTALQALRCTHGNNQGPVAAHLAKDARDRRGPDSGAQEAMEEQTATFAPGPQPRDDRLFGLDDLERSDVPDEERVARSSRT